MPMFRAPFKPAVGARRHAACMALLFSVWLVGCSSTPKTPPVEAPAQPSLQELLQQSEAAAKQGSRDLARSRYREAAAAYPTSKVPWQKLAEDYFEKADYGNAILAAQEVLQRDPQELVAHSILAVAGLRVSATSLTALREQRNGVPTNTRDEAAALTRTLRETLGETTLVPLAATAADPQASAAKPAARPVRRPPPRPVVAAASAPAAVAAPTPVAATAKPAAPAAPAAKPAGSGSPFDILKK
jgi:hypothetical protein